MPAGGASSSARLHVAQRWHLAFANFGFRSLHTPHRVVRDRVSFAQVVVQVRQGGKLAPDGGAGQTLIFQRGAPGQDVPAREQTKFFGFDNAGELHKSAQIVSIGAPGLVARQVGKPLGFGWHGGQPGKFRNGEGAWRGRAERLEVGGHQGHGSHSNYWQRFLSMIKKMKKGFRSHLARASARRTLIDLKTRFLARVSKLAWNDSAMNRTLFKVSSKVVPLFELSQCFGRSLADRHICFNQTPHPLHKTNCCRYEIAHR